MSRGTIGMTPALEEYVLRVGAHEPEILKQLRQETSELPNAQMQIGPEQGRFMGWLVELVGARHCLEIGVFTGYSSTVVALALPDDGHMVACDVDEGVTKVAERYWMLAGVRHKITLELRPARETLQVLVEAGRSGSFDFAFIDADKANYEHYYEACLRLLRKDGLLLIDNTLWSGRVVDPNATDVDTRAIVALNEKIRDDHRVSATLLPIADGLTLVRKR